MTDPRPPHQGLDFLDPVARSGALTDILTVREAGNAKLRLLGVIMCKVDARTRIAKIYLSSIRKEFEAAGELGAFETFITRATAVERAQAEGKTILQAEPDHKVSQQYRDLAREVLTRMDSADGVGQVIEASDA